LTNREIADILEQVATALELVSDNPFRARAYYAAARAVAAHPSPVADLARQGKLSDIKGVGASVAQSIYDIIENGSPAILDELLAEIPPGVWAMLSLPGLGPKRVRSLWRSLNITTLDELQEACRTNRLLSLDGFGEKTQARILHGIDLLRRNQGRLLLSDALEIAEQFMQHLAERAVCLSKVEPAGALRRRCETMDVIDVLVVIPTDADPNAVIALLGDVADQQVAFDSPADSTVCSEACPGQWRSVIIPFRGARIAVHIRPAGIAPVSLFLLTGNDNHVQECMALSQRLFGSSYRLSSEADIYKELGMQFVPPEMREGLGEVELARKCELPSLVEESDIKGVLHVHTNYSDGTHSIEEIVQHCLARGYEYVGIADHSQSAFYAGGLSPADLIRQHEAIQEIQRRFPGIRILHGIESDILADGSLDYGDELLAMLDFVIGSIHSRLTMPRDQMTARILAAVRNPYLSILGHPSGRLLLSRDGIHVDLEAVLAALAEEGKAVELNADPHRLDLDYKHCILAKRMGIPVAINPDAHSTFGIENLRYGVAIARKGWLASTDILNCLSASAIVDRFRRMRKA